MNRSPRNELVIAGGGLVGSLLAIFLVKRGYTVSIREKRPDIREPGCGAGRSINLIVTSRGIHALQQVGLWSEVSRLTVPVSGRMVHDPEGRTRYQPYGRDASECNHSISRAELNRVLLNEAERRRVRLHFDRPVAAVEVGAGGPRLIGADGAASVVRGEMVRRAVCDESVEMLEHGYKELSIPAASGGGFRVDQRALHIWPRGRVMLMALPNLDGSFTVTLYLPHRGSESFEALDSAPRVERFFASRFPDAIPLIPDLIPDFFDNPTGELGTVRCRPWHFGDGTLLIGDAAHAIVPFFGQGMNCGFEDCTVLDRLLDDHGEDWDRVLPAYTASRKPNADAIAEMALDNFVEMRDRVADAAFLLRKKVEQRLEIEMPDAYRSRYAMVNYSLVPYAVARQAGEIQREILDRLCADLTSAEELDLDRARSLIHARLTPYLRGI